MTHDVIVVGSANMDTFMTVSAIPAPGETVMGSSLMHAAGGKGANQAVAAARAGARTAFVAALGNDPQGDALRESLESAGVDLDAVLRTDDPTGQAFIPVAEDGENCIVVIPGANRSPLLVDHARTLTASAPVCLASLEIEQDVVIGAARRLADARLVLNASPVTTLRPELWDLVDVLLVNEHESVALAGTAGEEESIDVLLERVPTVVMTLGGRGCLVATRNERTHLPAHPATVIDTTGAGDTFSGYFAARLAAGDTPVDAARIAGIAGALATEVRGCQPSIPLMTEVEEGHRAH